MDQKHHWERVYQSTAPNRVSWFQLDPRISLRLVTKVAADAGAAIIDVGGGASTLVDGLLDRGFRRVTVLDLSAAALDHARTRLGAAAAQVTWREANVLTTEFPLASIDVWHDRAVFHFLTDPADRAQYVAQVKRAVRPGGHVLVATFGEGGPLRCSGLDVARYSPEQLHGAFGPAFRLMESVGEDHVTPSGTHQAFVYCLCRY